MVFISSLIKKVVKIKNLNENDLNGKIIFDLVKNNDEDCLKEFDNMIKLLVVGIVNICYVINLEVVILGGGIMV